MTLISKSLELTESIWAKHNKSDNLFDCIVAERESINKICSALLDDENILKKLYIKNITDEFSYKQDRVEAAFLKLLRGVAKSNTPQECNKVVSNCLPVVKYFLDDIL